MTMPLHTLSGRLAHVLHDLDPMGTCCRLNLDMEDEYTSEAPAIARLLDTGVPPREAVCRVFDEWFWKDCLLERCGEEGLSSLLAMLDEDLQRLSSSRDMPTLHEMLFDYILWDLSEAALDWDYADFMQTAPEQIDLTILDRSAIPADVPAIILDDADPAAEANDAKVFVGSFQPQLPKPGEPDPTGVLPWLHTLLFEKTRRRTPPEHLLSYQQFRQKAVR